MEKVSNTIRIRGKNKKILKAHENVKSLQVRKEKKKTLLDKPISLGFFLQGIWIWLTKNKKDKPTFNTRNYKNYRGKKKEREVKLPANPGGNWSSEEHLRGQSRH